MPPNMGPVNQPKIVSNLRMEHGFDCIKMIIRRGNK